MDEQHHGRALTLLIVIPAIYALVAELTKNEMIMKRFIATTVSNSISARGAAPQLELF